jgi:hypothetical protein
METDITGKGGHPLQTPRAFMEVLYLWGNTWLWDNMHEAIQDGSLIAVTDGSYIREQYPNLCSAAFVFKCNKGWGCLIGLFSKSLRVVNAYQGELLGLMAIHLILLSIDKINWAINRSAEIVSDCLGALRRITELPSYRILSRCKHSDILKNILVNCRVLSFTVHYRHVRAHQDDSTLFKNLSRKAQLNCICDHTAKQRIAIDGSGHRQSGSLFPAGANRYVHSGGEADVRHRQPIKLLGAPTTREGVLRLWRHNLARAV